MKKALKILFISDIHLGHRKNHAQSMVGNLNKFFSCEKRFMGVDLVVLVGDVFDEALTLNSEHVAHIDAWVANVLRLCHKHNVKLRVLEGTPSHDRGQSERFTIINEIYAQHGLGVDLRHVNTLSIEYFEDWDINVLYVPDEWNHSTDTTLQEVRDLMRSKGLSQVDFACMHGTMDYQLPAHIKNSPRHDSSAYSAMVRYMISIGHIHQFSVHDNIVAQGSFDRMCHGDEKPKGFISVEAEPRGNYSVEFVENELARKYITVVCQHDEMEDNLRQLDFAVKDLCAQSCVRVEAHHANAILANMDLLSARWPALTWSDLPRGKPDDNVEGALEDESIEYQPVSVRRDNITELVMNRLKKLQLSSDVLGICKEELLEIERM